MEDFQTDNKLHVFICITEKPHQASCAPKVSMQNFLDVKRWLVEEGLNKEISCARTGCMGLCSSKGGVMVVYPTKRSVRGITSIDEIKKVILEEYSKVK